MLTDLLLSWLVIFTHAKRTAVNIDVSKLLLSKFIEHTIHIRCRVLNSAVKT